MGLRGSANSRKEIALSSTRVKEMIRGGGPVPVKKVSIEIDGVTHHGTYYVRDSIVYVDAETGWKEAQVKGSTPEVIARTLLSELVRS